MMKRISRSLCLNYLWKGIRRYVRSLEESGNMKNIKALILDDEAIKSSAIKRALKSCGICDIRECSNQESGMEYIYQCLKEGSSVGLVVTDMYYPLEFGQEPDENGGIKLIERLTKENIEIPVIICSSINIREPRALGCVWYNKNRDLNMDFKDVVSRLQIQ